MMQPSIPPSFTRVASVADVPPGTGRAYSLERYDIAVFNVGGEFYALENSCPHQGGPIADGWVEDALVTCPWHGWCFDIRTGKMTLGDFARVRRFDVAISGGGVFVSNEPTDQGP
ncbi:MAG TPA: non-heme iron oxygenase ferredoxin subunit [Candidatus Baltobacteraceae bacterium]|jgi:nitrite reductase/ring-hydroxylating ferredoxin subunit|nr:non-heme iron oxygenase ferredoxin subunit [Candidatus Baltobacteraceae bacterium]